MSMLPVAPPLPIPKSADTMRRWSDTEKRYQVLHGDWHNVLQDAINKSVGTQRTREWVDMDRSTNLLRWMAEGRAVLYDRDPVISHDDAGALEFMQALLQAAGHTAFSQQLERDVIGLRDMFVRPHVYKEEDGKIRLSLRLVYPHRVEAGSDPNQPQIPRWLEETVWGVRPGTEKEEWTVHRIDIDRREYTVRTSDREDVTAIYLDSEYSGDGFYYVANGRPFMPYVHFPAARAPVMFDYTAEVELYEGTLAVAGNMSHWRHAMYRTSWSQRWAIDIELAADADVVEPGDRHPRNSVVADPATVLMFDSKADGRGQPQIGQWETPVDVLKMMEGIHSQMRLIVGSAGAAAPEFLRTSGDPRSGYALEISRDGQRTISERMAPIRRTPDELLLSTIAAMVNLIDPKIALPVDGWSIRYRALKLSPDEREKKIAEILQLLDKGIYTAVEARQKIERIDEDTLL